MAATKRKEEDSYLRRLQEELSKVYKLKHPHAQIDVKRTYPSCVRVRVIDPSFARKDRVDRDEAVWEVIRSLPEEWWDQLTLLILLTPKEAKTSLVNLFEFEELPPYIEEDHSPKQRAKKR